MAKLIKLSLENYRNHKHLELLFTGKDGKIVGANRIGKTNIIEAICFLLTDKLLGGSSDIPSIKPLDNTRAKVVVEGVFFTKEGEVTLRKEYYEKWVRPRGSASEELAGHSTDYYINGAKQAKAKDFFLQLQEKFGIPTEINGMDAYQLVIDPFYFGDVICASKDWKFARKTVIDIVGEVQPDEIFSINPDTKKAEQDLKLHQGNEAEAKKAINGEIDGYKKKTIANEGLIEEYTRAANLDIPQEQYEAAKAKVEQIDEEMAKLKLGNENPYAAEVTSLQQELYNLQNEYRKVATTPIDHTESERIRSELSSLRTDIAKLELQASSADYECNRIRRDLQEKVSLQQGYKAKLQELKDHYNSIVVETTCPTCGQPLPEEKVQEAVNRKKAEISAEGQRIKAIALENKKSIELLENTLSTLIGQDVSKDLTALKEKEDAKQKELVQALQTEQAQVKQPDPKIQERISEINTRLSQIRGLQAAGQEGVQEQLDVLRKDKADMQEILSKRISADNARKRIREIKEENASIGKKLSDAEQRLWAIGEFVRTKLQLLDQHMASKLGEVRFQLIKENIKAGSYDEVCVPYIIDPFTKKSTNTLFSDGSKSEQIYTGIQIIKAIRDAKGWEPLPILFDQGGELDAKSTANVAYYAEAQIIEVKVEGNATTPTFVPFENQ